jgi:5-methylcytosine-specific restriction endonuclease McrA
MAYTKEQRARVFRSADGRCHLCGLDLVEAHYGSEFCNVPTGWEIDHQRARVHGGTDHGNNLRPAHISCNRSRQARSAAAVRAENGLARPPLSRAKRNERQAGGAAVGAAIALLAGATTLAPVLIVAGIGALLVDA